MPYDRSHSHGLNDDYVNEVFLTVDGHGVLLDPPMLIGTFPANRYGEAIAMAQDYRHRGSSWAIVASRYADGCRWIDVGRAVPVPDVCSTCGDDAEWCSR